MPAVPWKDIINSKVNQPQEEMNARDIDLKNLKNNPPAAPPIDPTKSVTIDIDRRVAVPGESNSSFKLTINHKFSSPEELQETLQSIGYYGKPTIVYRLKKALGKVADLFLGPPKKK